jgi:hypothetical protein
VAADAELLKTALANMQALPRFTWAETLSVTNRVGDYVVPSDDPNADLPVDRILGVADRANQTYLVDIHLTAGITWTLVSQKGIQYWTDSPGVSQEVEGEDSVYYIWPEIQQGMWEIADYLDYPAALAQGVPVTLGTPPAEVIEGVPTVHMVMDLKAMPEIFASESAVSGSVEFWVTATPPARVLRMAHTFRTEFSAGSQTMKQVWTWASFNEPVQITLPPTVTPEP